MSASSRPTRGAVRGQREREVDGGRRLAHAALARRDRDDVPDALERLAVALHRLRLRPASRPSTTRARRGQSAREGCSSVGWRSSGVAAAREAQRRRRPRRRAAVDRHGLHSLASDCRRHPEVRFDDRFTGARAASGDSIVAASEPSSMSLERHGPEAAIVADTGRACSVGDQPRGASSPMRVA